MSAVLNKKVFALFMVLLTLITAVSLYGINENGLSREQLPAFVFSYLTLVLFSFGLSATTINLFDWKDGE